jgi:ribonuclease P protein component
LIRSIAHRRTFEAIARGRSGRCGPVRVRYAPAVGDDHAEVAFALPRRVGSAVLRNRVRRRLRAALVVAEREGRLPAGAYLVSAEAEAATRPFPILTDDVRSAVARAVTPR